MALPTAQTNGQMTAKDQQKALRELVASQQNQIAAALPRHMNPDRLVRIALTEISKNPKLAMTDKASFLGAIIQSAQLGLEPGVLGQSFLIPYGNKCQFVPGWRGLMDLLSRTERATATTGAVYEGDFFEWELGSHPKVTHKPGDNHGIGKITHVYAIGRVNGVEGIIPEVWSIARVEAHRDKYNKVGKAHYSFVHPEMYARKVVLLQVLKYLPSSVELQNAIQHNDAVEIGAIAGAEIPDVFLESAE